jgi:hypothetical protein
VTDTRSHWASQWILAVAGARIMEVYSNHTFLPNAPVRRGELALVVSRLLDVIAARRPELAAAWQNARGKFDDVGTGHLHYRAASRAVAANILTVEGESFYPSRPVAGADAITALEKIDALWRQAADR